MTIDLPSPCFVLETDKLKANLKKLSYLQEKTSVQILHTLKSFNNQKGLEIISDYLSGFSAGNQCEINMLKTLPSTHVHSYAPAFRSNEIKALASQSDTLSFNSLNQWERYASTASVDCSVGLRINPQLTLKQPKYCNPNYTMRLGVPYKTFLHLYTTDPELFQDLEGLHFHAFCSQGLDGLKYLLSHISKNYQEILPRLKWLNLGGGHQFTHTAYDTEGFIALVNAFQKQHPHLVLYFEPGESVVKDTGYFSTTILDIIPGNIPIVILDTSIEVHLLDVAITKRKPIVRGTSDQQTPYHYQLSGMSCIAGDTIGSYFFYETLHIGDKVIFDNMMGYTIVKQTEFNGIEKASFRKSALTNIST